MKCKYCGTINPDNAITCFQCGKQLKDNHSTKILLGMILALIMFIGGFTAGVFLRPKDKQKCNCADSDTKKEESKDIWNSEYKNIDIDVNNLKTEVEGTNELSNNIEIMKSFYNKEKGELHILAKNNNSVPINSTFYLDFKDSSGKVIDYTIASNTINANTMFSVTIRTSVEANKDVKDYSVKYEATNFKSVYKTIDESSIELSINDIPNNYANNPDIKVIAKNNSDIKIDMLYLLCVYYKGDEIVFANDNAGTNIGAGYSGEMNFYASTVDDISYDRYEVSIVSAINHSDY